jgi:hypothetical protein
LIAEVNRVLNRNRTGSVIEDNKDPNAPPVPPGAHYSLPPPPNRQPPSNSQQGSPSRQPQGSFNNTGASSLGGPVQQPQEL